MLDPFTRRRLIRFIEEYRARQGQLPSRQDLAGAGFTDDAVKAAVKAGVVEELYVTLTNGTIIKGFKIRQD